MRKTCFRCSEVKPLAEFYKHPQMANGHLGKCKECTKADVRENRSKRRSQYSAYERQRFQRLERKQQQLEAQRRRRAKDPQKDIARWTVLNAIRDGHLQRGVCEVCGEFGQAHHEDYTKPFEIRWLCFKHHRELAHGQVVVSDYGGHP